MKTFTLYSTSACHLCDIALEMLESVPNEVAEFAVNAVDIADSDDLFERYGVTIPVLAHPDGTELNWPFSAQQLQAFVTR